MAALLDRPLNVLATAQSNAALGEELLSFDPGRIAILQRPTAKTDPPLFHSCESSEHPLGGGHHPEDRPAFIPCPRVGTLIGDAAGCLNGRAQI